MSEILLELHFLRSGKKYEKELALGEEILAGKSEECDINLTDYFGKKVPINTMKHISRKHFKITQQKEGVVIFDLSWNGTRVNDEDLDRSSYPKVLYDGDIILLAEKPIFQIEVKVPVVTIPIHKRLYFDQAKSQFIVDRKPIPAGTLSKPEHILLKYLCDNARKICSRDEIAANVWGKEVANNTIDQTISKLRRKLDDVSSGASNYIETIHGVGYRLNN